MKEKAINLAVVGTGSIGLQHISSVLTTKGTKLSAICDSDGSRARETALKYGDLPWYTDYNEVLSRDDVDAVIVATNDQTHCEITVAALRAGKHVLCEKPMALLLKECKEMLHVSREAGRQLMVGQVCRYAPAFIKVKEMVDSGEIGELFFVESEYAHDYSKIPGNGNWRVDPVNLRHPVIGGGCHAVDLLRWIAGDPTEVFAYANKKCFTSWPTDDCTIALLKFPGGVNGKVLTSIGCKRNYTMRTVLYGTKGTIICDNQGNTFKVYKDVVNTDSSLFGISAQNLGIEVPVAVNSHNLAGEIAEFCTCIKDGVPVKTDGVEGASTIAVCTAIVESAEKEEKVKVDYDFK